MMRRLFNLAALLSLVLCLGCLFMWVRSWRVADFYRWCGSSTVVVGVSGSHRLFVSVSYWSKMSVRPPTGWRSYPVGELGFATQPSWQYLGFYVVRQHTAVVSEAGIGIPYWFLTLSSGGLSAWGWVRRGKRRQACRGFEVEVKQEAAS